MEWVHLLVNLIMFVCGMLMIRMGGYIVPILGLFIMGCSHAGWAIKVGHAAVHNSMCESPGINRALMMVFAEALQGYSVDLGHAKHAKIHHPHTNIIGLGDSAMWKVPLLPCSIHLFIVPALLPMASPFIAIADMIMERMWIPLMRFFVVYPLGTAFTIWLFMNVCDVTVGMAFFLCYAHRGVFGVPYLHVNVFQHIGLPMWDENHRPARMFQMTSGVLNLDYNFILDHLFGYSFYSCHIEHHLFPRLSDNMCLKVRPVVKKYVLEAGLPYIETSYTERLFTFCRRYDELMVNAPPITHFVGIQ